MLTVSSTHQLAKVLYLINMRRRNHESIPPQPELFSAKTLLLPYAEFVDISHLQLRLSFVWSAQLGLTTKTPAPDHAATRLCSVRFSI
jgi:hypothetical protein